MRVLLTGACGFVGSYVARRLLERGHAVTVTVRPSSDRWRIGDIAADLDVLLTPSVGAPTTTEWIARLKPQALVHLAWSGVGNAHRNDLAQFANITDGARLVEAAGSAGVRVVIGLGSQAEYGPSRAPTAETEPTNPTTFYGAAKLAAAHAYGQIAARSGARYAWIRLFSSYGPKDGSAWMVPYLISALLKGEPPALTLGEQVWDYLYVEDAAAAIVAVMEHSAASGIFNLGSGQGLALRSFVESIRDAIDPALPLGFGDVAYRSDQVMHLQADVSRLKAIGWLPLTSIEHGVRSTVAWSRARQAQDPTRT